MYLCITQKKRPEILVTTPEEVEGGAKLPSGVDLTLSELQDMATRQQSQIDSGQQMLVAKEQRLKFLKQQELRHQQIASENERLRKLREQVESQELKLKKLRALRGQVDQHKANNNNLSSELESIKALFNEKEKELAMAVAKVDDLTQQLEATRKGRINGMVGEQPTFSPTIIEIEKLRKELALKNKLNEQQNSKLITQKEILSKKKEETAKMDRRIEELRMRLDKKRKLANENTYNAPERGRHPGASKQTGSNIAAVEPYIQIVSKPPQDEYLKDGKGFPITKQDPKYQTLPPNTKFLHGDGGKETSEKIEKSEFKMDVNPDNNGMKNRSSMDYMPKNTIQGSRSYTQSYGHSTAVNAMEDTLQKSTVEDPKPPSSAKMMSNFVPRPYGSSYSTSSLVNRSGAPLIKPTEPVSSPSSSFSTSSPGGTPVSTPKTSTPIQSGGTTGSSTVAQMRELFLSGGGTSGPSQNSKGYFSHLPVDTSVTKPAMGPASPQSPPVYVASSRPNLPIQPQRTTDPPSPASNSSTGSGNQQQAKLPPPVAAKPNVKFNQGAGGSVTEDRLNPQEPQGAAPKYRYAPKTEIRNTYLKKLGNNTLDQYTKTMSSIYGDFVPGKPPTIPDSGAPTSTVQTSPTSSNTDTTDSAKPIGSPTGKAMGPPPPYPGASQTSPYNIDPVKYRPNAIKQLRRRLSAGETDELGLKVQKFQREAATDEDNNLFAPPDEFRDGSKNHAGSEVVRLDQVEDLNQDVKYDTNENKPIPAPTVDNRPMVLRRKKTNLKTPGSIRSSRRVSFDPLALLLDASLEGELDLVKRTAGEVPDPSAANDEGITALHNAICAGHYSVVEYLVEFGCNVNAPDSDGWTPLHCAASCNNLPMVKFLVEHGACIFATTISDQETAAEKCEEDEDGYDGCSEYLYSIQEKLGILNKGAVYAVFDYAAEANDEISFRIGDEIMVLRKGDENEKEWWWARKGDNEGYIPRNLLGLFPRVLPRDGRSPDNSK